jgi:putative inorganic carbon (hco3(-)) transporter
MSSRQSVPQTVAFWLVFCGALTTLVSIAVSQILIGVSFVALLVSRTSLRFPPVRLPLGLFFLGTVISLAFSADPIAGLPQIRKFYVFLVLLLVYSAFHTLRHVTRLGLAWILLGTASGVVALAQFVLKYREAAEIGVPFYEYYVGERITGFMSHWQTFGGEMMLVFCLLGALVLFAVQDRRRLLGSAACAAIVAAAIVLGFTRNIWLGSFVGGLYLLWFWRPRVILLVPIVLVAVIALGPDSLRARFTSLVQPHGEVDSNQHRIVTYRTGWRMIKANPLLGLGPEHVGIHFEEYVPQDVERLPEGWYGHLHNIYLHYAAERGVPTMLCLLWFLGRVLWDFSKAARRTSVDRGRWFFHGAVAGTLGIMTAGFFELNLGDTEVLTLFLGIVAAGYALIAAPPEKETNIA